MILTQYYHLTDALLYFIAAIIPIYFVFKSTSSSTNNNNNYHRCLRILSIIIASFVLMQGFYHVAGSLGLKLLSKGILEPFSISLLAVFAITYFIVNTSKTRKKEATP
ncbi:MAG TPA: hypothetical protein VI033_05930 [Candidatus Nitrosopolaris sp.]